MVHTMVFQRKIRTRLDFLSIPQSGGKNVKTFRWDHRLQIQSSRYWNYFEDYSRQ